MTTLRESRLPLSLAPTNSYLGLVSDGRKFAILQPSGVRLDIGIRRKGVETTERFEAAGSWNTMVTHRVRIGDRAEIDDEVLHWLRLAHGGS